MVFTHRKSSHLKHLSHDFKFYQTMAKRYLNLIGQEIVSLLEYAFGDGFVERWEIGDYEEDNCIAVHTRPLHEPQEYNELWEKGYVPLSQVLYDILKEIDDQFPVVYIYGEDLMSPDQAQEIERKIRDWLQL